MLPFRAVEVGERPVGFLLRKYVGVDAEGERRIGVRCRAMTFRPRNRPVLGLEPFYCENDCTQKALELSETVHLTRLPTDHSREFASDSSPNLEQNVPIAVLAPLREGRRCGAPAWSIDPAVGSIRNASA